MKVNLYVKLGFTFFYKFFLITLGILAVVIMIFYGPLVIMCIPFLSVFVSVPSILYTGFALLMYRLKFSKFIAYDNSYISYLSALFSLCLLLSFLAAKMDFYDDEGLTAIIVLSGALILPPIIFFLYFLYRKKHGIIEVDLFEGILDEDNY